MLKGIEKLRNGMFSGHPLCDATREDARMLADEIFVEVKKWCMYKPLFGDDEPVQFGDRFTDGIADLDYTVEGMLFWRDGRCELFNRNGERTMFHFGDRVSRPSNPYTQEQIDADAKLDSLDYCAKYSITYAGEETASIAVRKHLLARQRKLDGVEP